MNNSEKTHKILIAEADDFSQDVIEKLRRYAIVDVKSCQQENLKEILETYDVFWFRLGFKIDKSVLTESSRCKVIATPVTGIDHIDEGLCAKLGVEIVCLRGEREFLKEVRATSEMAIGLAMSVMRSIPRANQSVNSGYWERDWFRGNELYKKTLGIIGFGRLGSIMADYGKAFGMKVIAVEPRMEAKENVKGVRFTDTLEELAGASDVISLHVNYNKKTHHLLGEAFFRGCKSTAYFINTSRGGIVDEAALLKALQEKWIKGAGLDVLQGEPDIDTQNPLIQYANQNNNLVIVPHIGGNTYESFEKTEHFIANKILKFIGKET
jgi:D-3-phosphoglycerate dehydrogenase / 2-oxoglutarate reductase